MSSLLCSITFPQRSLCLRLTGLYRCYSTRPNAHNVSFEALGIERTVIRALGQAFPNVQTPTSAQAQFIPAVLQGKDVLLKGETGTGKSFGLVLALLNQERKQRRLETATGSTSSFLTTSLIITPHRDLAYQFMHWIGSILDTTPNALPLSSIAQVLLRNASAPISDQIQEVRSNAPQILIATPQALLEAMNHETDKLDLRGISTVVVDEADYLLETVPTGSDKYKRLKAEKNLLRHPSPTRQILELIYGSKREAGTFKIRQQAGQKKQYLNRGVFRPRPQLVLSSATLRAAFRASLLKEGWLTPVFGDLVKVGEAPKEKDTASATLGGRSIVHCALVVSEDGETTNIEGAITREDVPVVASAAERADNDSTLTDEVPLAIDPEVEGIDQEEITRFVSQPSPFNQLVLEAVAAAFAFDVPRVALLVLPADASVRRAVFDLRMLGVNAHGLDVLETARGGAYLLQHGTEAEENPTLLVSTLATTRGLDLPDLTHVFVLGVTEALTADAYLHVAGRVGRFGRPGKVIAVLESRREVVGKKKGKVNYKDEPKWLNKIYSTINVVPTKLDHFGDPEVPPTLKPARKMET